MTSLPPQVPGSRLNDPDIVSAYQRCLDLENQLETRNAGRNKLALVYVRLVGYLIHFVPTDTALKAIVDEIVSTGTDDALLRIGEKYYDQYLCTLRASKICTPVSSDDSSRDSFDSESEDDMVDDTLEETTPSYITAKQKALTRDGYRCVVSGEYDRYSMKAIPELRMKIKKGPNLTAAATQGVHILSRPPDVDIEFGGEKGGYPPTLWSIMNPDRHSVTNLPDELNGSQVHRLENVMTLCLDVRIMFDELSLWFLPTDVENMYKAHTVDALFLVGYREYVTFTTPDPLIYPVPSPEYLAIHAACAQVTHLSGAGRLIDELSEQMEGRTTLDPYGASGELLDHAIHQSQLAAQ